jgi:hypothetical protein
MSVATTYEKSEGYMACKAGVECDVSPNDEKGDVESDPSPNYHIISDFRHHRTL